MYTCLPLHLFTFMHLYLYTSVPEKPRSPPQRSRECSAAEATEAMSTQKAQQVRPTTQQLRTVYSLPAILVYCIPAMRVYLYTCMLVYLHTCILAYLHTCIPVYLYTSYLLRMPYYWLRTTYYLLVCTHTCTFILRASNPGSTRLMSGAPCAVRSISGTVYFALLAIRARHSMPDTLHCARTSLFVLLYF